jgi:hypothetical protein
MRSTRRWTSTDLRELKSGLGTGAVIVMDKSTDLVRRSPRISATSTSTRAAASARRAAKAPAGCGGSWTAWPRRGAQKREIDMLLDVTNPDRRPHHLRARRRGRLADPGPDPHFRHEIEERIEPATAAQAAFRAGADGGGVDHAHRQGRRHRGRRSRRDERAAGGELAGEGNPALLLPRAPVHRRQLPHVPRRGEARPAEAQASCAMGVRAAGPARMASRRRSSPTRRWSRRPAKG